MEGAGDVPTVDPLSKKQLRQRYTELKNVRQRGWDASFRERAEHLAPHRLRLFTTDTNDGRRKDAAIMNSHIRL